MIAEEIVLEGNVQDLAGEVSRFRIDKYRTDIPVYALTVQSDDSFTLRSIDLPHLFSSAFFGAGDIVSLLDKDGKVLKSGLRVADRYFVQGRRDLYPALEKRFSARREPYHTIHCSMMYEASQMEWLRVHNFPDDMSDKTILLVEEDAILIYHTWSPGTLVFEGHFRKLPSGRYEIYRLLTAGGDAPANEQESMDRFGRMLDLHLERKARLETLQADFMRNYSPGE